MSVSWGTQYAKLKTNLRLAANRLKLLQKKKTEQAMKARTEIADFLNTDKEDRARIRVESIIREDFVVEAYELLEMFCELLQARFGLIQQMKELDDGIAEAVSSILWVAPRISHECPEFKIINDQLTQKYGKQFAEAARMNQLPEPSRVSPKLIQKLSVSAPSKILVEKYLIEIARCANIDFTPDPKIMRDDEDEIANAERNLINFMNEEQIGWNMRPTNTISSNLPPNDFGNNSNYNDGNNSNIGGGSGGGSTLSQFSYPPPQYTAPTPPNQPAPLPNKGPPSPEFMYPSPNSDEFSKTSVQPQLPAYNNDQANSNANLQQNPTAHPTNQMPKLSAEEHIYEVPPETDFVPKFPEPPTDLPSYNDNSFNMQGNSSNEPKPLDFDDLARRFQELKKKL